MCLICLFLGMVATAARTILENLDRIPDQEKRVKIAIVAFDVSLYFFTVPVSKSQQYSVTELIHVM